MNAIRGVPAVFRFEWKRTLTVPRMAWWVLLTLFPPVLLGLIRLSVGSPPSNNSEITAIVVYVPCPGVVCMMGVFLWATPAISSELEGRSWVYLAVRPHGALSVLAGKYLVAVTWTIPAGLIAATLGVLFMFPDDLLHIMWVECLLVVLSCFSYAAVFTLIGVLFPKRTMAVGVFYALLFEVILAMIPAVINMLTIQYRLRCLGVRWMNWDEQLPFDNPDAGPFQTYFGDETAWWHFGVLLAMTAGMLIAAAAILRWREFTTSAETDV